MPSLDRCNCICRGSSQQPAAAAKNLTKYAANTRSPELGWPKIAGIKYACDPWQSSSLNSECVPQNAASHHVPPHSWSSASGIGDGIATSNKHKGRRSHTGHGYGCGLGARTDSGSGIWSEPSGPLTAADILRSLFICLASPSIARN